MMRLPILITIVRLLIHFMNVLTFALILTGGGPESGDTSLGAVALSAGVRGIPDGRGQCAGDPSLSSERRSDRDQSVPVSPTWGPKMSRKPKWRSRSRGRRAVHHRAEPDYSGRRAGAHSVGAIHLTEADASDPEVPTTPRPRKTRRSNTTPSCSKPGLQVRS